MLTWEPSPSEVVVSYEIEARKTAEKTFKNIGSSTTDELLVNLESGHDWFWKVIAVAADGSTAESAVSEVSVVATAPAPPSRLVGYIPSEDELEVRKESAMPIVPNTNAPIPQADGSTILPPNTSDDAEVEDFEGGMDDLAGFMADED